jgi:dolichol-phosphate mannosyltransferase
MIQAIQDNLPSSILAEIVVVDDNSPDGTGRIVEDYAHNTVTSSSEQQNNNCSVKVIRRPGKSGLISAILTGVESSAGENILVMDADFSHPPEMIPEMLSQLTMTHCDLVVASRYIRGGSVRGWPYKRRMISTAATEIAKHGLNVGNVKDPMSGFFAVKRHVIEKIKFDTAGYKILLEILVKADGIKIKEIPYTFVNRKSGTSKLTTDVMIDYTRAVWRLYRYGRKSKRATQIEERKSVLFISKAARFYTVGASGVLVNYLVSFLLSNGILSSFWYIHATTVGIAVSITTNFILNKAWTFEDRDFSALRTLKQYGMFAGFSTVGAVIQLTLVYLFVQSYAMQYSSALILAIAVASIGNFLFNKKWTFHEKVWG